MWKFSWFVAASIAGDCSSYVRNVSYLRVDSL
jgi:hypothetical protein